jgi:hypothetical protein
MSVRREDVHSLQCHFCGREAELEAYASDAAEGRRNFPRFGQT